MEEKDTSPNTPMADADLPLNDPDDLQIATLPSSSTDSGDDIHDSGAVDDATASDVSEVDGATDLLLMKVVAARAASVAVGVPLEVQAERPSVITATTTQVGSPVENTGSNTGNEVDLMKIVASRCRRTPECATASEGLPSLESHVTTRIPAATEKGAGDKIDLIDPNTKAIGRASEGDNTELSASAPEDVHVPVVPLDRTVSMPGAYSVAPGQAEQLRLDDFSSNLLGGEREGGSLPVVEEADSAGPAHDAGRCGGSQELERLAVDESRTGTTSAGSIATAVVVDEEVVQLASAYTPRSSSKRFDISEKSVCLILLAVAGIVSGVAVILIFTVKSDSEKLTLEQAPISASDPIPVTSIKFLQDLLPRELVPSEFQTGFSQETNLFAFSSPQAQAFHWLSEDPSLYNYTEKRAVQRFALATLFHATSGHEWTNQDNWLSYDVHECLWYNWGMFMAIGDIEMNDYPCNNETGVYERLWLGNNNLNGTLPDEAFALTNLKSMDLVWNGNLKGEISPKIQKLTRLEKLSVGLCNMGGTIPSEIGALSQMRYLYLTGDTRKQERFHGTIPSEFWQLTKLEKLGLTQNKLSGTLPVALADLTNLVDLGAQSNSFAGMLPTELGLMQE